MDDKFVMLKISLWSLCVALVDMSSHVLSTQKLPTKTHTDHQHISKSVQIVYDSTLH